MPDPPSDSGQPSIDWFEPRIGEFDIKLRVWFSCSGDPPLEYWGQTIRRINVLPPDRDIIVSGVGVDSEGFPNMSVPVVFQIQTGETECGGVIDGGPYERIERFWPWSAPVYIWDSGFVPGDENFSLDSGGQITDIKRVQLETYEQYLSWEDLPIGAVFDEFYQTNMIVVKNSDSDDVDCIFARRKFQRQKSDYWNFKIVLVE
ncbi:MAG: hypothetical protein KJZ87_02600 [Thermoguttaceae bacterium]|nr:hypothetical protein [Thermoguttaceae bacterium]